MRRLALLLWLVSCVPAQAQFTVPVGDLLTTDLEVLAAGSNGTGVVSGATVTAQGSPNMTVAVASGVIRVGTTTASVASGNVTITAAHGSLDRIDLVVANNAGTKSAVAGTPAGGNGPDAPDIPSNSVVLAFVYIPANDVTINANQLVDKRVIVPPVTGTGSSVFGTAPTITLTNGTGLPLTTGVTGDLPYANIVQTTGASKLLGRGSASGAGDWQEITFGDGLAVTGTVVDLTGDELELGTARQLLRVNAGATANEYVAFGTAAEGEITFAGLPSCVAGRLANLSDANTATWGATITAGGSSNHVLARCNGTVWTVVGK